MILRIWRWILILLVGAGMLLPAAGLAQGEITLSELEVDLWPEYDRPTILVIYRVTLPATVTLPVDLTFRIPAAAGDPSAVAVRQVTATGEAGLFTIPFERQVNGEWGLISLTATMPELQIEYYDPGLGIQGANRQFVYQWPGDYTVEMLTLQVQQPIGATDMQISPATDAGVVGQDGLTYFNKLVGSLPSGQTFRLEFSYQKEDQELSVSSLQVQPSAPVTQMPTSQFDLRAWLPWILGFLGLALIVGGGVWYWQSGKARAAQARPARRRRTSAARQDSIPAGGHIYCHQCGNRAMPGDRFCRSCGERLRSE